MSCEEKKPSLGCADPKGDFFFKSCLCDQVKNPELLASNLQKEVALNGKVEEKLIEALDSIGWEKELALFFSSDIKKGTAEKFYTYARECIPDEDGVCHHVYKLKKGEKGDVTYMRVSRSVEERIDSVEIHTNADNYIYKGAKELKFRMDYSKEQPLLSTFEVKMGQKVVTKDSNDFYVRGVIQN